MNNQLIETILEANRNNIVDNQERFVSDSLLINKYVGGLSELNLYYIRYYDIQYGLILDKAILSPTQEKAMLKCTLAVGMELDEATVSRITHYEITKVWVYDYMKQDKNGDDYLMLPYIMYKAILKSLTFEQLTDICKNHHLI